MLELINDSTKLLTKDSHRNVEFTTMNCMSQDSPEVTGYRMNGWGFIHDGGRGFSFHHHNQTSSRAHQPPIQWVFPLLHTQEFPS